MRLYETVFVVNPELPLKDAQELSEKYQEIIKKNTGEIVNTETWGKLRLAYEVQGHREGLYFLIQFKSDTELLPELEKRFKYDDNVMRYAIIHLDGKKFKLRKKSDEKNKNERTRNPRKPQTIESDSIPDEGIPANQKSENANDNEQNGINETTTVSENN